MKLSNKLGLSMVKIDIIEIDMIRMGSQESQYRMYKENDTDLIIDDYLDI